MIWRVDENGHKYLPRRKQYPIETKEDLLRFISLYREPGVCNIVEVLLCNWHYLYNLPQNPWPYQITPKGFYLYILDSLGLTEIYAEASVEAEKKKYLQQLENL